MIQRRNEGNDAREMCHTHLLSRGDQGMDRSGGGFAREQRHVDAAIRVREGLGNENCRARLFSHLNRRLSERPNARMHQVRI